MTEKYRLMVYFAVATLHLYRGSLRGTSDDSLLTFKRKNTDLILRVCQEARSIFDYELSAEQMDRAIAAFRSPPQFVSNTDAYQIEGCAS